MRLVLIIVIFILISDLLFGRAVRRTIAMQGDILASKALSESVLDVIEKMIFHMIHYAGCRMMKMETLRPLYTIPSFSIN